MKKLLGIMVLGLLWCNSAYALKAKVGEKSPRHIIFKISTLAKNQASKESVRREAMYKARQHCKSYSKEAYLFHNQGKVIDYGYFEKFDGFDFDSGKSFGTSYKVRFICGSNVNEAKVNLRSYSGKFKPDSAFRVSDEALSWITSEDDFQTMWTLTENVNRQKLEEEEEREQQSAEEDAKIAKQLEPYKRTCREIGYSEGTDKFGDCVMKLIAMDQKSGEAQAMDDANRLERAKILLGLSQTIGQGSSSSSSGSCNLQNWKISGHNKLCYYYCPTGDKVLNIKATANCPNRN